MLALLILNLEQSGKYTAFPRESHRSAAELILCGHSSGTWSFHSFLFFLSLLEGLQQVMQKKWSACAGEVTGVRESDQWRLILCVCVFLRVGHKHGRLPPTLSVHSPLSLPLCFREAFISPAPTHSCVLTVKGERHQYSTPAALSALTYCRQSDPIQGGCEPLHLKYKVSSAT